MWLHVPPSHLPSSASVPAEAVSTLDLSLLALELAPSAMWRSTSLQPRSWRRVLRAAGFLTRLSGLTYSRSEAESGVASWMASLAASRASLTATPASEPELMTPETSGLSLRGWYGTLRQRGRSSRTFQASFLTTTESYGQTLKPWATRLRRDSSQRRRLGRAIFANASSGWPTARAHEAGGWQKGNHATPTLTLSGAVQNWPTPSTAPEAPNTNINTVNSPTSLGEAAQQWQTPNVQGFESRRQQGDAERLAILGAQAKAWATPTSHDGRRPGADVHSTQGNNLSRDSATWATPMTNDGAKPSAGNRTESDLSHQAQAMQTDGDDGSPTGRVLNHRFVRLLMGWPELDESMSYESTVLELYRWRQHMRASLSALGWRLGDDV